MTAAAPLYAAVADSRVGRLLHVKDSWHVAEPLWHEREAVAAAAAAKRRKGKGQGGRKPPVGGAAAGADAAAAKRT